MTWYCITSIIAISNICYHKWCHVPNFRVNHSYYKNLLFQPTTSERNSLDFLIRVLVKILKKLSYLYDYDWVWVTFFTLHSLHYATDSTVFFSLFNLKKHYKLCLFFNNNLLHMQPEVLNIETFKLFKTNVLKFLNKKF